MNIAFLYSQKLYIPFISKCLVMNLYVQVEISLNMDSFTCLHGQINQYSMCKPSLYQAKIIGSTVSILSSSNLFLKQGIVQNNGISFIHIKYNSHYIQININLKKYINIYIYYPNLSQYYTIRCLIIS